jgi:hypothetical protein
MHSGGGLSRHDKGLVRRMHDDLVLAVALALWRLQSQAKEAGA